MAEPPVTTQSGVFGVSPATSATPTSTRGAVGGVIPKTSARPVTTVGPVGEVFVETTATPITTVSPVAAYTAAQFVELALVSPLSKVGGRTHSQPAVGLHVLGRAIEVDLTVGGSVGIFEANVSKTGIISYVLVVCTLADAVTVLPTARLTIDGNDVYSSQQLLGLDDVNKVWSWPLGLVASKAVQSGRVVIFEVVTPSVATTHQADIFVYGYET